MKKYLAFLLFAVLVYGCASSSTKSDPSRLTKEIERVVFNLDQAIYIQSHKRARDWSLRQGNGMLITYEYLRSLLSFEDLQSIAPMDVFLKGPHGKKELNLLDPYEFGHYNPAFVEYFHGAIQTLLDNREFVASTRQAMNDYGLTEKLVRLYEIKQYIEDNPQEFVRMRDNYKKMLDNRTWSEDGYREYMPAGLDSNYYWNWSETNYYFWIRRDLDGTMELWNRVIIDILKAYQF